MISFKEFCRLDEAIPVSAQGAMRYINLIKQGIKAKTIDISDVKNNMFVVTFTNVSKLNNQNMSLLLSNNGNKISNIVGVAISDEILDTTAKFKPIPSNITSIKDIINGLIAISKITSMSKTVSAFKDSEDSEDLNVVSLSGVEDKEDSHQFKPKTTDELKALIKRFIEERGVNADLNDIDVSLITDMSYLFAKSKFNGDISKWDVSNVKDISCMFYESSFNGDISKWDVSKVKYARDVFSYSKFNGNISRWNISDTAATDYMFANSKIKNNLPNWYKLKHNIRN